MHGWIHQITSAPWQTEWKKKKNNSWRLWRQCFETITRDLKCQAAQTLTSHWRTRKLPHFEIPFQSTIPIPKTASLWNTIQHVKQIYLQFITMCLEIGWLTVSLVLIHFNLYSNIRKALHLISSPEKKLRRDAVNVIINKSWRWTSFLKQISNCHLADPNTV